jgi:hypothetical protein
MRNFTLFILLCLQLNAVKSQKANPNFLSWSADHKLTAADFLMPARHTVNGGSYAQFSIEFEVNGFDLFTKNFNKKIHNRLIKSASWIDTAHNADISLRFQQTLFDICEIYTRQFRKELKENKKQLAKGFAIAKELNAKAMEAFTKRCREYEDDTQDGTNSAKQLEWEQQIELELAALKAFAAE